jgi:hypothetical protein
MPTDLDMDLDPHKPSLPGRKEKTDPGTRRPPDGHVQVKWYTHHPVATRSTLNRPPPRPTRPTDAGGDLWPSDDAKRIIADIA